MIKRILLLTLTNVAVLVLLTAVISVLHLDRWLTAAGINYPLLLAFSLVVGFLGSFVSLAISKWMAKAAYDIQVIDSPQTEGEEWLVNTVRELAARARIAMPEVGIYESPEVNAFATGPSRSNALVAVSTGLLSQMDRRQIAGVLGHEITHIANGDMVTMALLQGVVNTFVVFLSRIIGFAIDSFLNRGEDERRGVGIGFYFGMFLSEIVLGLLASLIVAWYSRQREFRADAGSARIAGRGAMLSALRGLQALTEGEPVLDERSASLSAFKINGRAGGFLALLATHPPLEERIAALERLPETA
ncbi:membrane-associated Zn-dependent endopeptidase; self-cleaved [Methylacidimicrobium sp. AP8]|uniref:protease HtpX n=1 Tax=Methylacidimicrobium sp. AP8 TaxID=2730359 RepID=UPI0018BFF7C2|nr:protease HtpX [Methylacidimicrobium sp. AP8]CAB4244213.1 membrane-associated Zn-dependent endopeptidase; self-cleaved [Methylacidimicrobium sp. AP8]